MYKIYDVANWFLQKESMDHKKVQKLCYYAQAWSLTLSGKKMIDCDFEAWAHGPVCRELWTELRSHTYLAIPQHALEKKAEKIKDKDTLQILKRVWATYKDFNGYQLEVLTHKESPWINARGDTPEYQKCTSKISEDDMAEYYNKLYTGDGVGE